MVRFAISPKDPRLSVLVGALDREDAPAAETWRLVCRAAERLGIRSPSYQHVRRLVAVERRRRLVGSDGDDVLAPEDSLFAARIPNAMLALERLRQLEPREEVVLQQHEPFSR